MYLLKNPYPNQNDDINLPLWLISDIPPAVHVAKMTKEMLRCLLSSSSPQVTPACGLVSILKKRSVCVSACSGPVKAPAKRRVRFKVTDDSYDQGWLSKMFGTHAFLLNFSHRKNQCNIFLYCFK